MLHNNVQTRLFLLFLLLLGCSCCLPLCHPSLFVVLSSSSLSFISQFTVSTVPRLCRCLLRLPGFSRALLIAAVRDAEEVFFPPRPPTAEVTAATTLPCNHSSTAALRWVSASAVQTGASSMFDGQSGTQRKLQVSKSTFFAHREKLESIRTRPSDQQYV